jgi:hypothetical protein
MAAAAAADSTYPPSPFSRMPAGNTAAAEQGIVACPSVGGPHHPTTAAAAAAAAAAGGDAGVCTALTCTNSQLFSVGSAAPSAASGPVGSARMGGPVTMMVGMWKIMTSYLQVRGNCFN